MVLAMSLPSLTSVLGSPRRGTPPRFIGYAQENYDRRANFRRAADTFQTEPSRRTDQRAPTQKARRRAADNEASQTNTGHSRRTTDAGTPVGLHLKVSSAPEFVRHSTPFVAQAIGQERGTINVVPRNLNLGTAAYDAGIARVDSFFSVIEPISVYV
jgi:hypothetical protein